MQHALRYIGGFERNFPTLTPASTTFEGTDGQKHSYEAWPDGIDGLRIGFMEKAGKKFVAVRVADDINDVVLLNEIVLQAGDHFGFGMHLSGTPLVLDDDVATMKLLEDIIRKNVELSGELLLIRTRFKAATHAR
jgi:hypothetical protein